MKQSAILTLLLLAITACNNQPAESGQAESDASAADEKEMAQYLTPKQKSVHLFNLPGDVSEEQLMTMVSQMNAAIEELGYPGVGYHVYKVENDTIQEYRYFLEGLWPDPETYRIIHDNEKWKQVADNHAEMWKKVEAVELYRRVVKVEVGI